MITLLIILIILGVLLLIVCGGALILLDPLIAIGIIYCIVKLIKKLGDK